VDTGCDHTGNAIGNILGLDLAGKDLAFKFGLRVAGDVDGEVENGRALGSPFALV
jgi:hypothetical protein